MPSSPVQGLSFFVCGDWLRQSPRLDRYKKSDLADVILDHFALATPNDIQERGLQKVRHAFQP